MKKYFLLTPGPTPIPPEVAQKEALPILHHRTTEFGKIFLNVLEGLKYVFQTKNDVLLLTCSGTGAMESAITNFFSPNDKVIFASCGVFGDRWAEIGKKYNLEIIKIDAEWGKAVAPELIKKSLNENPDVKGVFVTHTETSTGVVNNLKTIGEIVKETPAILCVDAISGLAGQELRTDEWNLDVVVSASQKGLMCAPGLAFVSVSKKASELLVNSKLPKFYFDLKRVMDFLKKKETPFTPAVSLVVALNEAISLIKTLTLENIWKNTERLAIATREAAKSIGLKLFADENCACNVLTAIKVPNGIDGEKIVDTLREEFGVSIAEGQQKLKGKIIRIAHMGFISETDLSVAFGALEIVLDRFGYKLEFGKSVGKLNSVLSGGEGVKKSAA